MCPTPPIWGQLQATRYIEYLAHNAYDTPTHDIPTAFHWCRVPTKVEKVSDVSSFIRWYLIPMKSITMGIGALVNLWCTYLYTSYTYDGPNRFCVDFCFSAILCCFSRGKSIQLNYRWMPLLLTRTGSNSTASFLCNVKVTIEKNDTMVWNEIIYNSDLFVVRIMPWALPFHQTEAKPHTLTPWSPRFTEWI